MIIEHVGNLLDVTKGIIVHGCNCQGVMGSGVAKSIRDKWPSVYNAYNDHYNFEGLHLGDTIPVCGERNTNSIHISKYTHQLPEELIVVNAMTQYEYGGVKGVVYVDYDAVAACFSCIKLLARDTGLPVHFPLIGCGLANGDWNIVSEIIESALGPDIEKHLWRLA